MRLIRIAPFLQVIVLIPLISIAEVECDQPDAPETVRIYFANGMSNENKDAFKSQDALMNALGMQEKDFGLAYNDNEFWLEQLLQVYEQRQNESDAFWHWLRNMEQAPQWFRDEYAAKAGRFNQQMVQGDPDLAQHIRQYLGDLVSGKKVVIVAHSQGNFYANNAYRHIFINYPEYRNSIGIVSVATPATWVEGGGSYQIDNVYTTNPEDLVINLVRFLYDDTLPANVSEYDNPDSWIDHEFVETYFSHDPRAYRARIINQILQRVASLETPEKDFECMDPDEVPVDVATHYVSNITSNTARLHGYVQSGKQIATYFFWKNATDGKAPPTCDEKRDTIPTTGTRNTDDSFYYTATDLKHSTTYTFRVCGRREDNIADGGVLSFTTATICGTPLSAEGGSEGFSTAYGMGQTAGYAQVTFEAYTIPDKLEIWQGNSKIYTTGGFVSGTQTSRVYHNPSMGQTWQVRVTGNSSSATFWDLEISCPK